MNRAIQQVWKQVLRSLGSGAAMFLLSPTLASAQPSQFLFDANGNLAVQTAAIIAPPQCQRRSIVRSEWRFSRISAIQLTKYGMAE